MTACPDENALGAYLVRQLPADAAAAIDAHLDGCAACRTAALEVGAAAARPPATTAAPGSRLGRYLVLRLLGAGGFGVVYAAYDPQLDRRIALKLVRARDAADDPAAAERRLGEARAMAQLSSPHVVAVYDVQELDGALAIAMELIDGGDMREWLRARPRATAEIVAVFMAAGRGLAVAHAAGLVHRDFKPANVLIGRDGRVAVSDFGLAHDSGAGDAAGGAMLAAGTPAYMAPEQYAGVATARADQFGFCVALYEALTGEHPFAGDGAAAIVAAVQAGRRRPARALPERLRRALDRGLEADPARRFDSMADLLAALSPPPPSAGRRAALALGAIALLVGGAVALRVSERARLCSGAPARVAELWSAEARAGLGRAFARSGAPYAEERWQAAARAIDRYLERWGVLYTDACAATRLRGEQPEPVLAARMACLEDGRAELAALLRVFGAADAGVVANAVGSLSALGDPGACENVHSLTAPAPPPAPSAAAVATARAALAEARALRDAGRFDAAKAPLGRALTAARALDYAPLSAEALLLDGALAALAADHGRAEAALTDAVRQAARGRHDRVAAQAWIELADLALLRRQADVGLTLGVAAEAALARAGGDHALEARLGTTTGLILGSAGRYDEALARHRDALRLLVEAYGRGDARLGPAQHRVAEMLWELGRHDEARDYAVRAEAAIAAAFGEHHPLRALPLTLVGAHACARGDWDGCGRAIDEAIVVRMSGVPPGHPTFLPMLLVRAQALAGSGRFAEADGELDEAARVARAAYGAGDAWLARVDVARAEARLGAGQAAAAIALAEPAARALAAALGADHGDAAAAEVTRGRALLGLGRAAAAEAAFVRAARAYQRRFGAATPLAMAPLVGAAQAEVVRGAPAAARRSLAQALAVAADGDSLDVRAARTLARQLGVARP